MDYYFEIRDSGYLGRGDDGKGRLIAMVPEKNSPIQERKCSEFPYKVKHLLSNVFESKTIILPITLTAPELT